MSTVVMGATYIYPGLSSPQTPARRSDAVLEHREELADTVTGLLDGWLEQRNGDESFRAFCDRSSDEELGLLAGQEPAKSRRDEKEEVVV